MTNPPAPRRRHTLIFLAVSLLAPVSAPGGGFQMVDQSARAMGLGGAVGALSGDPAAMHTNPALLSFLEGPIFSLGATVKVPDETFEGVSPSTAQTKMQAQVLFLRAYVFHTPPREGSEPG